MTDLTKLSTDEIIDLIRLGKIGAAELTDSSICPTCFDRANNHVLYGENHDKMIFEDDKFECFLVGNPRAEGHSAISTKKHFKDMMEIDDETCKEIFVMANKLMNIIKEAYKAESVYLSQCVMAQ